MTTKEERKRAFIEIITLVLFAIIGYLAVGRWGILAGLVIGVIDYSSTRIEIGLEKIAYSLNSEKDRKIDVNSEKNIQREPRI